MKKQIIILFLFSIQASAQNAKFPKLKISVPCNQEFLDNYKGKWLIPADALYSSPTKDFSQGAMKRIRDIHQLILQVYPEPIGADGYWGAGNLKTNFAEKVKYVTEDGLSRMESVSAKPVFGWSYGFTLCPWYCDDKDKKQIWNGYPDVGDGTGISIRANDLSAIVNGAAADDSIMTINQQQIKYKMAVIGTWKGYDMMNVVAAELENNRLLLINRQGMLPYIPVTRKQYIDRAMAYVTKFYDGLIANPNVTDDGMKEASLKLKNQAIQMYKDALFESEKNGLLDAPAIISNGPLGEANGPIFSTEEQGGRMLVIDNPNYFRKDLPGCVPQLFVIEWMWGKLKSSTDFRKAIEENFPIEKLQAMIDK